MNAAPTPAIVNNEVNIKVSVPAIEAMKTLICPGSEVILITYVFKRVTLKRF